MEVFKPGNVSIHACGHGMQAEDFLASAEVALPCLLDRSHAVSDRIYRAVAATRERVGCNTNLGILLLLGPLAEAALRPATGPLKHRLREVLQDVGRESLAPLAAAIRLANPGGLGSAGQHDVHSADVEVGTVAEAMSVASHRDRIAWQYSYGFEDICGLGMAAANAARPGLEVLSVYLQFLTAFPDSHVQRKHGAEVAEAVRAMAEPVALLLKACENPPALVEPLSDLDKALKRGSINPGTSADLTVATMAAVAVEALLMGGSADTALNTTWSDAVFQ